MKRQAFGLLLGLGVMLGAGGAQATQAQKYALTLAGLPVGELSMAVNEEGDRYTVRGTVRGGGLASLVVDFHYTGLASGWIRGATALRPIRYEGTRRLRGDARTTTIRYNGVAPAEVRWDPGRNKRDYDIDPGAQKNTLDPASATYALLKDRPVAETCAQTVEIFDGTRRSRVVVAARQGDDKGFLCQGVYTRIAGFPADDMAERTRFPFTMYYEVRDGVARMVRFQTTSIVGKVVARRQ